MFVVFKFAYANRCYRLVWLFCAAEVHIAAKSAVPVYFWETRPDVEQYFLLKSVRAIKGHSHVTSYNN